MQSATSRPVVRRNGLVSCAIMALSSDHVTRHIGFTCCLLGCFGKLRSRTAQPASRHVIKLFSIEPIIANIRSSAEKHLAIWGRRCGECPFAFFAAKPHDLNPASFRMLAMIMRITYRPRGLRFSATPRPARFASCARVTRAARSIGRVACAARRHGGVAARKAQAFVFAR